jgi:hypothetical protein
MPPVPFQIWPIHGSKRGNLTGSSQITTAHGRRIVWGGSIAKPGRRLQRIGWAEHVPRVAREPQGTVRDERPDLQGLGWKSAVLRGILVAPPKRVALSAAGTIGAGHGMSRRFATRLCGRPGIGGSVARIVNGYHYRHRPMRGAAPYCYGSDNGACFGCRSCNADDLGFRLRAQ